MTFLCKIYRGTLKFSSIFKCIQRTYSISGKCGGDKKGGKTPGGKGSGDKPPCNQDEEPDECPVCQCPSDCNPSTPTMYDCRKYGHSLPSNNVLPCFEPLPNIPTGIFRCTSGEVLGNGAQKCSYYQNPEYFAYHHMTYYDMHLILRCCRKPSPKTGRKP